MNSLLITIIVAIFSHACNCLHLKNHQDLTSTLTLNSMEETLAASIAQLNENKQNSNKKLLQIQGVEEKITFLQNYLLQQRKVLLKIIKQSNLDLNTTHYVCPNIPDSDKVALSLFNQKMATQFSNLANLKVKLGSEKDQNAISNEINEISNFLTLNSLPGNAQSSQNFTKLTKVININFGSLLLENYTIESLGSKQQSIEICPFDNPFTNKNSECLQCPSDKPYFSSTSLTCTSCSSYNQSARQCNSGNLYFTNFVAKDRVLLSESEKIDDYQNNKQNLPLCPLQKPFYDGKACVQCSSKLYFSLKDKTCQTCPSGKFYNIYQNKCQVQLYFSNLNNLEWETNSKQIDDILESITIKRSNESYTSCPLDLPFSLEDKCIKCEKGMHFSYDSFSCTKCSSDTQLDSNMHRCLKPGNLNFQTNPANTSSLIFNGKSKNQWMNIYYQNIQKYSGIADCPLDLPNFDGLACIFCPHSHPYFNLQLLICQTCQGTTLYDAAQHQCVNDNDNRPVQTPSWEKMAAVVFSK